ncbi:MAG: PQQ-binding-like beta-propeller repeat protein [Planctomycetes bacterium]|nr:PQQ-binding-like beta-propeller repeat protein [Planctomycetota bacterium]
MRLSLLLFICSILTPTIQAAEIWPEFRGPAGDGHARNAKLPTRWSETENVRWKTKLPGRGWSTPVIVGDRLWMTAAMADGHELFVLCVDGKSGKIVHQRKLFQVDEPEACNKMNSYASPSPVTDGECVYVYYGTYGVACLDANSGETVWSRRDVNLDHQEGPGSSMILHEGRLIFHCDGRDVQFLTALECQTGETAWQTKRSIDLSAVGDFSRKAFTTPLITDAGGGVRLISPAAQGCYCYDPYDGSEIWQVQYSGFSAVPRPVVFKDVAFVVDGFAKPKIYAIRLDGKGDVTDSHVKWVYSQNGPSTPSPILLDDHLMFVSDAGIFSSIDAETGKLRWRERIGGNFSASPLAANGLVYLFDREGKTTVIRPGAAAEVVAVNQLAEGLMASASVSGNSLFLRTREHLYCIE